MAVESLNATFFLQILVVFLQLLSNVLLFAAADKIAKLLILLLAKGSLLLHEVLIIC